MVIGYCAAVACVVGVAGTGRTGDHGGPECARTVCLPVPDQKKVTTKSYSDRLQEFCQVPLPSLFGPPRCGPVRTKKLLVLHTHTREEPATKYIPVVEGARPACPPAVTGQPVPGAGPPVMTPPVGPAPGPMPPGQFPK
jgi:hypothetical protein